jgi:HK97 family phage major capsid protein
MDEEQILKEIAKVGKQLAGFQKDLGEKISKEDLEKANKAVSDLTADFKKMSDEKVGETVKSIKDTIDKFQIQMEEMKESVDLAKEGSKSRSAFKSFGTIVVEALKEAGYFDKKLGKGEHRTLDIPAEKVSLAHIVNKNAANMGTGNVSAVGSNSIPYELAEFESGLARIATRSPFLMQIANVSPIGTMYAQWAEQANRDGAANETAQGSAKNQIDFDWVEKSAKVEKITAYIKVSKEALSDLPGLANEIDTELREMVLLKADTDLLSGDGTTPSLNGLLNQDTAWVGTGFTGTIANPTFSDVLRTAVNQVVLAYFRPTHIILHPTDVAKMDLEKDSQGRYQLAPFKSSNGMIVSGVPIIENPGQTVGQFTVGDFTKFRVRVREGITIDMGLDSTDFTLNLVTILGEIRLVAYVKANHQTAFVTGTFAAAQADIALVP